MRALLVAASLAAAAFGTVSCGSITSPSQNQTDTFTGTITPASQGGTGSDTKSFTVSNKGEYTVKVTSMSPSFSGYFATYIGHGDNCAVGDGQNNFSTVGVQALAGPIFQTGQYCVIVSDFYNQMTAKTTYTIVVSHP